jgi:hypothetical protein
MTSMRALHRTLLTFAAAAVAATLASGSAKADPDGLVVAVVQQASIDARTGRKTLMPAHPIYSGDRVVTDQIGEAQIKFRDNTRLVIGPNSTMIIDAFVFNKDDTARKVSINAVKGAFRFISGNSPKDAYTITTPTSTIGIRG